MIKMWIFGPQAGRKSTFLEKKGEVHRTRLKGPNSRHTPPLLLSIPTILKRGVLCPGDNFVL
jgi:hypothetical protein